MKNQLKIWVLLSILWIGCQKFCTAQRTLHQIDLWGGLIAQPPADLYAGSIDYHVLLRVGQDQLRIGLHPSILYHRRSLDAAIGPDIYARIARFSALNNNLSLGGIFLNAGYQIGTSDLQFVHIGTHLEFTQFAIQLKYSRELGFDQNWFTYGFSFLFSKPESDPDE